MEQPYSVSQSLTTLFKTFPRTQAFTELFGLTLPVIQAPMAGADNHALAIETAASGAMGSRGMGYASASHIRETIIALREQTSHYNINVFIPDASLYPWPKDDMKHRVDKLRQHLQPYYQSLGLSQLPLDDIDIPQLFSEQLAVIMEEKIPCLSFAFGLLDEATITQCHQQGTKVMGTATTVQEAKSLEKSGCDAIVVQGLEAGGHRGGFSSTSLKGQMPLLALLGELKDDIHIPMIAAGGIRDGARAYDCFQAGASAVQIGSALLVCSDCTSISQAYQQLMRKASSDQIQTTPAISGRQAQGIRNRLFKTMQMFYDAHPDERLPYPLPHLLTATLRKFAAEQNHADWVAAWCGVHTTPFHEGTLHTFLQQLIVDASLSCR